MKSYEMHESVLVGFVCQATGWLSCELGHIQRAQAAPADTPALNSHSDKQRLLDAINLSHNPFDPAIGDLLITASEPGGAPEFYTFELKVEWALITEELAKFAAKHPKDTDAAKSIAAIQAAHPKAVAAHYFGGLVVPAGDISKKLEVAQYWAAFSAAKDKRQKPVSTNILHLLADIALRDPSDPQRPKGVTVHELIAYMAALNQSAKGTSRAANGSIKFFATYSKYKLYLFDAPAMAKLIAKLVPPAALQPAPAQASADGESADPTNPTGTLQPAAMSSRQIGQLANSMREKFFPATTAGAEEEAQPADAPGRTGPPKTRVKPS